MVNPYAPPTEAKLAPVDSPLPSGVHRYRLAVSRSLVRRSLLWVEVPILGLLTIGMALPWCSGAVPGTVQSLVFSAAVLASMALLMVVSWPLAARATKRRLSSVELLISSRVLRVAIDGLRPMEVLRPEVSRIVAMPGGVWVVSEHPRRAVGFSRDFVDYDELCARLDVWKTIDSLDRWRGLLFRLPFFLKGGVGPRDQVEGTSLATDASLREELALVRSLSSVSVAAPKRQLRAIRLVLLWVLLIIMFVALHKAFSTE